MEAPSYTEDRPTRHQGDRAIPHAMLRPCTQPGSMRGGVVDVLTALDFSIPAGLSAYVPLTAVTLRAATLTWRQAG
jgi:hypothetical protein